MIGRLISTAEVGKWSVLRWWSGVSHPRAVELQLKDSARFDNEALTTLEDRTASGRDRVIRDWLDSYKVLQGFNAGQRDAIARAVLDWADKRDMKRDLKTVDTLDAAHATRAADLMEHTSHLCSSEPMPWAELNVGNPLETNVIS